MGAKLKPHTCVSVNPLLGAPTGCQSVRRVKLLHGTLKNFHPVELSTNLYSNRSEVSVVLPAARLSDTSSRIVEPVLPPLNQNSMA
jgi:hypothetical protein